MWRTPWARPGRRRIYGSCAGKPTASGSPRVACGVYYGQQAEGSAVPIAEGLALPAGYDINMAEHMALIIALRRHAALILEVSLDVLLERLGRLGT
jgi:hypothetical protein